MTAQTQDTDLQAQDLPSNSEVQKPTGRPTTYQAATAELICARLADGETLTSVCKTPGMPARQTVHMWRMRIPAFDARYARAREIGMEAMSDDVLAIADDDTLDILKDGTVNNANVQRARLMVDTRKFLMGKLAPHVYGERIEHKHSGGVEHRVTLSDRERMRRLATFLAEDMRAGVLIEGSADEGEDLQAEPASPSSMQARPSLEAAHNSADMDEPRARDDEI